MREGWVKAGLHFTRIPGVMWEYHGKWGPLPPSAPDVSRIYAFDGRRVQHILVMQPRYAHSHRYMIIYLQNRSIEPILQMPFAELLGAVLSALNRRFRPGVHAPRAGSEPHATQCARSACLAGPRG